MIHIYNTFPFEATSFFRTFNGAKRPRKTGLFLVLYHTICNHEILMNRGSSQGRACAQNSLTKATITKWGFHLAKLTSLCGCRGALKKSHMKKFTLLHTFLVAVLYVSGTLCALSQDWNQILKLSNADRTTRSVAGRGADYFGNAIAVDGNYAVVGAFIEAHDAGGNNPISEAGSVLVLKNIGGEWIQVKKLVAFDRNLEDRFGYSVSISGTTIVVGVPNEDEDALGANPLTTAGSAYIFSKDQGGTDNWGLVKKIVPSERAAYDAFGNAVSVSGNIVVVGSYLDDEDINGANYMLGSGSAYIFSKDLGGTNNWGQVKKIVPADRSEYDGFGYSLTISGNTLIAGCYQDDRDTDGLNSMANAGSVYIFSKDQGGLNNWGQAKKIVSPERANGDKFGQSVAFSNGILVVGAPYEDEDASGTNTRAQAGSAYVFAQDYGSPGNWAFMKKLVASDRAAEDYFSYAVAIYNNHIVVGAYAESEDANGSNTMPGAGSAYIFSKNQGGINNWGQVKKAVAPDRAGTDQYGIAVAAADSTFFIGAQMQDVDFNGLNYLNSAGAVYVLQENLGGGLTWGQRQKLVLLDVVPDQYFGYSVAIDGDYAVAGVRNDFSDAAGQNHQMEAGSAWILKNENGLWTPIKKLVASDRNSFDHFGGAVAISGETVVVGASWEAEDASGSNTLANAGSAYIFSKNQGGAGNWGQVKKITAPIRAVGDVFGYSVAISGNTVVVGAYQEDEDAAEANPIPNAGAAYVFYKDQGGAGNWGLVKKIIATDRVKDDQFGLAVDIDFNTIVVGAASGDYGSTNSGAAYIYSKDQGGSNNWGQLKKIGANDRAAYDFFGSSVAISGNTIAIGAYGEDEDASGGAFLSGAGAAYIFLKDQNGLDAWGQLAKLVAGDRASSDMFGMAIALDDTIVVVSAGQEDEDVTGGNTLSQAGSAYIFTQNRGGINQWGLVQKITAGDRAVTDRFGYTYGVGVSGQTIIAAAYMEDEDASGKNGVSNAGSLYFFKGGCGQYAMSGSSGTVVGNQGSSGKMYYNNNCTVIAGVAPSGENPITGSTVARVWIKTEQPANYVTRVYEITPALNPETATGRVTLYFSQAEFDAFNAVNTLKLPTGSTDAAGKANLLIEKRTGQSSDGSGSPYSYTGSIETINPADNDIIWNGAQNRWEVSFDVVGFSGFFVKTTTGILPLKWVGFTGLLNTHRQAILYWTVQEHNILAYNIEKSTNGQRYQSIGWLQGLGDGEHKYSFTEEATLRGEAYYRIRQTDKTGMYSYSPVLRLKNTTTGALSVYPNPVGSSFTIITDPLQNNLLQVCDAQGRMVMQVTVTSQPQTVDVSRLPNSVYLLRYGSGASVKIVKQ